MTLFINNQDVEQVLTMRDTIEVLESAYSDLASHHAVCRPRIDIQIPTKDPARLYRWGTMEGGSRSGYFAIRMKSDIVYEQQYQGLVTHEKYCVEPGTYCGLVFLISIENGEPLALINDGVLQHMRVGADAAIGARAMARKDAKVVGMLGSGGMARTHMAAFMEVRNIKKLKVFSPTKANREAFAQEIRDKYKIEVEVHEDPRGVYQDVDILAGVTDSATPVIRGEWVERGTHVTNVGGGGKPGRDFLDRVDLYLRFGNAPAPMGLPQFALADEYLTYAAMSEDDENFVTKAHGKRGHGMALDKVMFFSDLSNNEKSGRTADHQITYSERGNLQGLQFFAVAGRIYELAREKGLGHHLPTDWFLQDIRN